MKIASAVLFLALSTAGQIFAAEQTPPRYKNIETPGNLESKYDLGCEKKETLSRKHTPADLYRGLSRCLDSASYSEGAFIFALAGVYGRFDSLRVEDKTAYQALAVLQMQAVGTKDQSKREAFMETVKTKTGDPALCKDIMRIGMPDYYPRYMIQHGMAAMLMALDPAYARAQGTGDGLVKGFDAKAAWKKSLSTYLRCPEL